MTAKPRDRSLRSRILVFFLWSMLPVLFLLVAAVEFLLVPYLESRSWSELTNSTRLLTNAVRASASVAIRNHLRAIAERNLEIASYQFDLVEQGMLPREEAVRQLRRILLSQRVGDSGYIYCVNSKGEAELHPEPEVQGTNRSDFAFVREQLARKQGYLEYDWKNPGEPAPRQKALYMVYFKPLDWIISVSSYKSEFSQLLDPEDFRETVLSARFGENGYSYVMNIDGEVLIHPVYRDFNVFEQDEQPVDFLRHMLSIRSGRVEYEWKTPDDEEIRRKIAVFDSIPEYGWVVASSAYWSEVMRPVQLARSVAYSAIALLLLAAVLSAYFLSGRVMRPVDAMVRWLDRRADQGRHEPMPVEKGTELGRLAEEFNRFIARIDEQNETLRRERLRYRSLFEASPDAILLLRGMTIIDCNPATRRMFGCEPFELIGRTVVDLSPTQQPDSPSREKARSVIEEAFKTGDLVSFEWVHHTLDGKPFETEIRAKPFYEAENEPLLVGFARDITERKRADAELRRLREYLESVIDAMPSILIGLTPDGMVTQWNAAASVATDISVRDAVGRPLSVVFPELELDTNWVREAIRTSTVLRRPKRSRMAQGEIRYEDVVVYPLANAEVKGVVVRVDDVTERVRLEELMLQSEKMLSVGGLAAGMAHEINNPLGGIMQTASVMADRLTNRDLEANTRAAEEAGTSMEAIGAFMESRGILRMLGRIRESGTRAADIVSNMLSFARKSDTASVPQDLASLLDKSVALAGSDYDLKKSYDFRQIEIIRVYEERMPPVPCEPAKVQQVLLNILRNGAEAMWQDQRNGADKPPRLILRTYVDRGKRVACMEIEDNGPGMDEDTRRRVFEPFYTTKSPDLGTGLGLSVSYFIITENHGGELTVESKPGRGARFTIRLPLDGTSSS